MNTMIIFMIGCLALGLWTKPRFRYGLALTAGLAVLLVIYFILRPYEL